MIDKIISQPIEEHLKEFDAYFKDLMRSKVSLLDLIIKYITKKRGKQVRPAMVFLSAGVCGGISKRSFTGAAMAELLHTATLVHDDVVDQADKRRGIATINASWNNKIAVLIGDYLLAKGLLEAIDGGEFDFLRATSNAVRRMSEGELLQIQKSKEFSSDEDTYFRIIADKTASLLAACCEIGAISATDDKDKQKTMREFGEMIGIAFQIRDDIFDYQGNSSIIGKPVGNDLREKKITLPLLYSLGRVPKDKAKEISRLVKNGKIKNKEIKMVIDFVNEQGGIAYAEEKARYYIGRAVNLLEPFEDSPYKSAMMDFSRFVLERNK